MNFTELQKSWQAQQAPEAARAKNEGAVLENVKKLQRKVIFSNLIMSVCLALTSVYLGWMWANLDSRSPWMHAGMALIFLDMFLTMPLIWLRSVPWGNLQPDLSSRDYIKAALKSFRFRQTSQQVIMPIYGFILFLGIHLVYLGIFENRPLQQRLIVHAAGTAFMILIGFISYYSQRNKYRKKYEPVVKELEELERELEE